MGEKLFRMIEKIIIFLILVLIVFIIKDYLILPKISNYIFNKPVVVKKLTLDKYKCLYMTATAYTRHIDCISERLDDGYTATGKNVEEGKYVAINVDLVNRKWVVNSMLKLGQKICITTMQDELIGYFYVEDTGPFKVGDVRGASLEDLEWDRRNCDIYVENIELARKMGCIPVKVYIIG